MVDLNISSWISGPIKDGVLGLLGEVVVFAGGAASHALYGWFKKRFQPSLKLLGLSAGSNWSVYFGNTKTVDDRTVAFEKSGAGYVYGDMEATLRVIEVVSGLVGKPPSYFRALDNPKDIKGAVISIGGPKWNTATECFIGDLGSPVRYKEGSKSLFIQRKGQTGEHELKFERESLANNCVRDYGVVLVGKRGYFHKQEDSNIESVCVIMGYSTLGVRVAAEYVKKMAFPSKLTAKRLAADKIPPEVDRYCVIVTADISTTVSGEYLRHVEVREEVILEGEFLDAYTYKYG
jgi:hypothetical protein